MGCFGTKKCCSAQDTKHEEMGRKAVLAIDLKVVMIHGLRGFEKYSGQLLGKNLAPWLGSQGLR